MNSLTYWPRLKKDLWSKFHLWLKIKHQDRHNPESGPKFTADPWSTVFSKSANPLDLRQKSTIHTLFKVKSVSPKTYSPPSDWFTGLSLEWLLPSVWHIGFDYLTLNWNDTLCSKKHFQVLPTKVDRNFFKLVGCNTTDLQETWRLSHLTTVIQIQMWLTSSTRPQSTDRGQHAAL